MDDRVTNQVFFVELAVTRGELIFQEPINGIEKITPNDGWVIISKPFYNSEPPSEDTPIPAGQKSRSDGKPFTRQGLNEAPLGMDRAKTFHQFVKQNIIRNFEQGGGAAKVRVLSWIRDEVILEEDRSFGIDILAGVPSFSDY